MMQLYEIIAELERFVADRKEELAKAEKWRDQVLNDLVKAQKMLECVKGER